MKKFFLACVGGLALLCCGFVFQPIVAKADEGQTIGYQELETEALIAEVSSVEENINENQDVEKIEPAASLPTNSMVVQGNISWQDTRLRSHPLILTKVEVYEGGGELLGSVYTDYEGHYSFSCTRSGVSEVYLQVVPQGNNSQVTDANFNLYEYTTASVTASSSVGINVTLNMSDFAGQAFQISQAVIIASQYIESTLKMTLPMVTVHYPHNSDDGHGIGKHCFYNRENSIIYMANQNESGSGIAPYEAWDVIMHEYGHHVGYHLQMSDNPGGDHSFGDDLVVRYGKDKGIRLAWGEAFATMFGAMAQDYYVKYLSQDEQNINTVADGGYTNYGMTTPMAYENLDIPYIGAEGNEKVIIEILWDMFDGFNYAEMRDSDSINQTEEDRFALGHDFWELLCYYPTSTFSEFINNVTSNNKDIQMVRNISYLLAPYGINATDLVWSQNEGAFSLSWMPNGGTTEQYKNNTFYIYFYDIYGNVSYVIDSTEVAARKSVGTDGRITYTLTTAQWNNVLYTYGTSFDVAVLAYQDAVETTSNGGQATCRTGGYMSICISVSKPVYNQFFGAGLLPNSNFFEHIISLSPGSSFRFRLRSATPSMRIFQTFGLNDTILELYDMNGNLLASDDDSGYETNAFLAYSLTYGQDYIIHVRFVAGGYGTTKLVIAPANGIFRDTEEPLSFESFMTYENVTSARFSFSSKPYTIKTIVFQPRETGIYEFDLRLGTEASIYVLDPRSTNNITLSLDYANSEEGGIYVLFRKKLERGVPYVIMFGAKDPSTTHVNSSATLFIERVS